MTAPTVAPGWYHDGVTFGSLRWFDGAQWTEHVTPDISAGAAAPVVGGWNPGYHPMYLRPEDAAPEANGPDSAMHWVVPVGRSWQAILAGYLGLFSLGLWAIGPVSIGFGIWALVRASRGGHGRGRAITGIVGGVLGTAFMVLFLISEARLG
ncbi:MAG: DUF2510 domain-containing protein [Cellulomonadaceae bacterium]|nr:DUF2510 domain-containing protein [Cellulomonadaceae bacterium]